MSTDTSQRVFRQKLAYRWLFPTLTFCSLVVAIATTCLLLVESNSRIVANLCICAWLIVLVYGKPSLTVFTTIAVCEDGIEIHWLRGSRYIPFQDVVSIDVQRARRRLTIRTHLDVIYITPSYRDVDDLIDLLEIKIHPHLEVVPAKPKEKPERTGAVVIPRIFRRSRRLRVRTFLGVFVYLIPAAVLTWFAVESSSLLLFTVAPVFGFFSSFTIRDSLRLMDTLVVDQSGVTSRSLFGTVRVEYDDIVEVIARGPLNLRLPYRECVRLQLLAHFSLRLRSNSAAINCDRDFEHSNEMVDLITSRIPRTILDKPLSEEFRYQRFYRIAVPTCLFLFSAVILVSIGSIVLSEHTDGYYWEIFPITVFGFMAMLSIFVFLETRQTVYLERDRVVSVTGQKRLVIPYERIVRIERERSWHGEERLIISAERHRLKIACQVDRFDDLIRILDDVVGVRWKGENAVSFPFEVRTRAWWLEPLLYLFMGVLMVIGGVWFGLESMEGGEDRWRIVFWLVGGVATGLLMIVLGGYYVVLRPVSGFFNEDWLTLSFPYGDRTYAASQVHSVVLREDDERRRVEVKVSGRRFVFTEPTASVPLVPLYKLLCKTYWPEGYRDPEGSVIAGRTTSESNE